MDVVYLGIAAALLLLLIGLVFGCDRLMRQGSRGSSSANARPGAPL